MTELNETHDPALSSWVESANDKHTDFPIQNLPFSVFRRAGSKEHFRVGVAIGDQVLDLTCLKDTGLYTGKATFVLETCCDDSMNRLMALGQEYWSQLRLDLSRTLREDFSKRHMIEPYLIPEIDVEYAVQASIGDYTDFYTSIHHATSVGKQFRPDNPLLPNYQWVPIGYHGRSSSIGITGQQFHRPVGQTRAPDSDHPSVGPAKRMDFELEIGIFIGPGNNMGEAISINAAEQHVFGICLFNDWSARDIQAWEYQPLGPFLSKNFASTLSPWIVTMEALAPFRRQWARAEDHPQPLKYLESTNNRASGALDIELQVLLHSDRMQNEGEHPVMLAATNFKHSYWSVAQMVAHHSVNGCNLRSGDLLGSGTQSGPEPAEAGSMLELSCGGTSPIELGNGETRTFLEDGDTVIMRGYCEREGARRIGFGEVTGTLLSAKL